MKEEMEFNILLEEHASSDCKECLIKAYNLGAREELNKLYWFMIDNSSKANEWEEWENYNKAVEYLKKRLRELGL